MKTRVGYRSDSYIIIVFHIHSYMCPSEITIHLAIPTTTYWYEDIAIGTYLKEPAEPLFY